MNAENRDKMTLWYRKPAEEWAEALPVGNGRLGGMVFGGVKHERIQLNEDTLWSGTPEDPNNYEAAGHLEEVRRLVFEGRYTDAQEIIERHMTGPWSDNYLPLGDLELSFAHGAEATDYRRELDLETAVARTKYTVDGTRYTREVYVSAPDQVMVVRIESDSKEAIDVQISLGSALNYSVRKTGIDMIALSGQAPSLVQPLHQKSPEPIVYEEGKGIRFEIRLQAVSEGGRLEVSGGRIRVQAANAVTLLLAAATSFNGFDKDPHAEGNDPAALFSQPLAEASRRGYAELLERHTEDYRTYFKRVDFELEGEDRSGIPVDARIQSVKGGVSDEQLAVLMFQYGRYLLISSSRPGTQPATLQGIWNDKPRPPWSCNYTANINVQMNYWPAESCNLPELHGPLFDMLDDLRITGARTARAYYQARGWCCHHNIDLWRIATPSRGSASWAFWPMAGPWLCQHLWEHYAFGGDVGFLKQRAYPVMKEAALFCLDWLIEDGEGRLVTNPSTSPENSFIAPDGRKSAVSAGSTMDIVLIRELFTACIESCRILGEDQMFREELERARDRLPRLQIGRYGQLQEWSEDFEEAEPGHRHTAHLYALHPGRQIVPHIHPELAAACRVTLERRLQHEREDMIGWCFAWQINQFARLEDAETAHKYLTRFLGNPHPNMINAHRHPKLKFHPLTIEANFAATAGIAEMLLQSHAGEISLLPALPLDWPSGRIKGLRARGAFEVELEWNEGALQQAAVKSLKGNVCRIRTKTPVQVSCGPDSIAAVEIGPSVLEFPTQAGEVYLLQAGTGDRERESDKGGRRQWYPGT
ncbi:glycoside hydrolase N-terminal domain-containing protein [Paenibacillus tarimensis]